MKASFNTKGLIAIVAIALQTSLTFAQFQMGNNPFNYGRTNPAPGLNPAAIGIGSFPNGTPPLSALHINTNAPFPANGTFAPGEVFRTNSPAGLTAWRMFSANLAANEKFSLFNPAASNNITLQTSQASSRFTFNTGGATQRMIVTSGTDANGNDAPRIGIGGPNLTTPLTYLHLGEDAFATVGYRNWMNIGVYMHKRYNQSHDNMYVGLRELPNMRTDAIINWGNNPVGSSEADRLRFVFTSPPGSFGGLGAGSADGLEVARMIVDNTNVGKVGIGNFFTPNVDPVNTLEIRSDVTATTLNPITATAQTRSGLRFTNLNSTMSVDANNNTNTTHTTPSVLSVNENGDVILVNGGTGLGTCTAPTILSSGNGGINLNNNNFYFLGQSTTSERVGVGIPCGTNPAAKLEVLTSAGAQLRLTQAFSIPGFPFPTPARFTDFQTTSGGNLRINPSDGIFGINPTVGINIPAGQEPLNTLEIVSGFSAPTPSGLRLRNLTSSATTITNPGTGVLSVNANGDVIYVPSGSGSGFGTCASSPTTLSANSGTNLNNFKLYFLGNGVPNANQIGVGYGCNNSMFAKFNVFQNSYVYSSFGSTKYAIAVSGYTSSPSASLSIGVMGISSSSTGVNCGIYASVATAQGGSPNDIAGYFNGDIDHTGNINFVSDSSLKENIGTINNALNLMKGLSPKSFTFKTTPYLALPTGTQFGLMAQDAENILPELVSDITVPDEFDSLGNVVNPGQTFKALNYTGLIPITIQAVKELDSTVSTLLPPPPTTLVSPANGDTGLPVMIDIQLIWHSVPQGNAYTVFIASSLDPKGIGEYNTSDTSFFYRTKSCNTVFSWWVVVNNNNGYSDKSEIWSFTTGGPGVSTPPTLVSPANGDTTNIGLQLSWYPVSNTTQYSIFVSASPNDAELITSYGTSDTSIYISVPFDNFTYYWWVKSWNCSGESDASEIRTFYARQIVKEPPPIYPSDSRYKINVTLIDSALEKVLLLDGVNFDWNRADYPQMNFDSIRAMGFIAQQVQPIVPEVVHQNDTGALSLDYARMVALLVEAIKQQQATISGLQTALANSQVATVDSQFQAITSQISQMQSCIDNLPPGMCGSARMANPDLTNEDDRSMSQQINLISSGAAILYQNEPNPFGNSTLIRYYLPENTKEAMLVFYDEFGREITKESLQQKGYAKIDVNAEKLAAGIYTYSIVVDGKVADTKKMVRTK